MAEARGELWQTIFDAKQFDPTKDLHLITATEIKQLTGAEPRNMAKFDASADLPPVLKRHGYFLLPIKNGTYAIVRGNGFHRLEASTAPTEHVSRIAFTLTTAGRGSSEMQYLDYSFNAGALESLVGASPLYASIRGREYSRPFKFRVNQTELDVASVQLEVDSGLEGEDCIVLVEAKIPTPEDFIVRQLFYPYNHFKVISPAKKIIPVFFSYEPAAKTYNFWIYEFADVHDYNSIRFKESRSFTIVTKNPIKLDDLQPQGLVAYKELIPQANDLSKVIELVFKVSEGLDNYQSIAEHFGFNERQSSYYREAAQALGLVTTEKRRYKLTDIGRQLIRLPTERRNLFVANLTSEFRLVRSGLELLKTKGALTQEDMEELIGQQSQLSGSTILRRAHSLKAWFRWLAETTGSLAEVEGAFVAKQ